MSKETRQKISKNHIENGTFKGGNNPNAKPVCCEDKEYECIEYCAIFYNENPSTMRNWLKNKRMPKEWYDRGLRCKGDNMDDYTIIGERKKKERGKIVFCGGYLFLSLEKCSIFYNKKSSTMGKWINNKNPMPQEFIDLGLRYATEEDINTYDFLEI